MFQVVNSAAKTYYMSAGRVRLPTYLRFVAEFISTTDIPFLQNTL